MNIVVCVKQTFDTEAKIVFDSQGRIDPNGVNLIVNPYDEFALEEGIRLKEKFGGTVTAVSMGGARAQEALRTALAMGADKALLVSDPALNDADEWVSTQALAQAISKIPYDIILAGRVAIDDGSSQVCVRVAEELHVPSVSTVVKFSVEGNKATAVREIDGGTETLEIELPVVLTAQKGINGNEPRYPSVAGIMKAKKKELKTMTLADLGLAALEPKMKISKYDLPTPRQAGKKVPGEPAAAAQELVKLLHEEAKVL